EYGQKAMQSIPVVESSLNAIMRNQIRPHAATIAARPRANRPARKTPPNHFSPIAMPHTLKIVSTNNADRRPADICIGPLLLPLLRRRRLRRLRRRGRSSSSSIGDESIGSASSTGGGGGAGGCGAGLGRGAGLSAVTLCFTGGA